MSIESSDQETVKGGTIPVLAAGATRAEWFEFFITRMQPYFAVNNMYVFYKEQTSDIPRRFPELPRSGDTAAQTKFAEDYDIKSEGEYARVSIKACGILQLALSHHPDLQSLVVEAAGDYYAAVTAVEARATGGAVAYIEERRAHINTIVQGASDFAQLDSAP